ncbi:MAG: zinc-binding dehydrogenase [Armatimonadota bacterium]|jgi:threonine 3-dehydrogenase|nr:zinc-binding dehydrogenase [Fimbriimonadaceae bacterium]MCZ8139118.1 zinc-binding dehydrogenase [Fimbriimonadaceae bacterium]
MKAIAKTRADAGLDLIEVNEPELRPGHVKLRVLAGSVCGTDRHIDVWDAWAASRIRPPRIIGHEFCGEIIEVADDVKDRFVGQIVASESHIVDPNSEWVKRGEGHIDPDTVILGVDVDGGFAPYAVIPAQNARPIPEGYPIELACMMDALGNGVHTVMDGPVAGQTVLITGLGPIGLFAIAICKAMGAAQIVATEVSEYRIALGEKLGADHIINPMSDDAYEMCQRLAPGGFDATLEMSGHPGSLDLAIEATRQGGRVSLLGLFPDRLRFMDMNRVVMKGMRLQGIAGRRLWDTWDQMHDLIVNKGLDIEPIKTHVMPFTEYQDAFATLASGHAGKIVLRFDS